MSSVDGCVTLKPVDTHFKTASPKQQFQKKFTSRFNNFRSSYQLQLIAYFVKNGKLYFSHVLKDSSFGKYLAYTPIRSKLKILHRPLPVQIRFSGNCLSKRLDGSCPSPCVRIKECMNANERLSIIKSDKTACKTQYSRDEPLTNQHHSATSKLNLKFLILGPSFVVLANMVSALSQSMDVMQGCQTT